MANNYMQSELMTNNNRKVPVDFLPLNEKDITLEWAKKTYNKSHLFSDSITSLAWDTHNDLLEWINIAKLLMKDIKWNGVRAGRARILQLAVHKYNLKLPSNSMDFSMETLSPLNVNDVVEIVTNPTWYNERKLEKQAIIHELIYGITRKVHNFWLIEAEKKWMSQYNIEYQSPNFNRITETRGFVYKLMNSIFSNTTIKLFKRAMVSRLGEYISVRDNAKLWQKQPQEVNDNCSIIQHKFPTGKGYIIKTNISTNSSSNDSCHDVALEEVKKWINTSIKNGTSINDVLSTVKNIYLREFSKKVPNDDDTSPPLFGYETKNSEITTAFTNNRTQHVVSPIGKLTM